MTATYDVVTVGGGLGGAALAKSLSERGVHVLVLEQVREFKDRVRGETMPPWGTAEARALGVYEPLSQTCGHEHPWFDIFLGPVQLMHRHLPTTTPQGAPGFNFYHPSMQETLLGAAAGAGAEVRRGAAVTDMRQALFQCLRGCRRSPRDFRPPGGVRRRPVVAGAPAL